MISQYFQTLYYSEMQGASGLFAVYKDKDNHNANDQWFCCAYKDKDRYKKTVVQLTNKILKLNTSMDDWEFHHIIERQHISDIPLAALGLGYLDYYYSNMIPTVIISKKEHKLLSKYFHFKEFRQLYFINEQYSNRSNAISRQSAANKNFASGTTTKQNIKKIIDDLSHMYESAYLDHEVFRTISRNFFRELKKQII